MKYSLDQSVEKIAAERKWPLGRSEGASCLIPLEAVRS
jgi:hypothetical protein